MVFFKPAFWLKYSFSRLASSADSFVINGESCPYASGVYLLAGCSISLANATSVKPTLTQNSVYALNTSTFIDTEKMNGEIDNKIRTDYATALQSVKSVFEEVRKLLSRADCPNSEEIKCADMGLFSSFPITPNDVEYLITNHSTDYTFLKYVKYWIDNKESEEKINLHSVDLIPDGAVNLIEKINSENVDKIQIESFADPDFAKSLYLQVGSGAELINKFDRDFYSTNCDHRLDDCVLTTVPANNMPPMPL